MDQLQCCRLVNGVGFCPVDTKLKCFLDVGDINCIKMDRILESPTFDKTAAPSPDQLNVSDS